MTLEVECFVRPLLAVNASDAPPTTAPEVRQALRTIERYVHTRAQEVGLAA